VFYFSSTIINRFLSRLYIVNKRRSSLDPQTVNMHVCLRDWCRWHYLFI